ncbi:MAG: ribbon-helix-helix domain-containing protein [Methermicoccaceae archaeon]
MAGNWTRVYLPSKMVERIDKMVEDGLWASRTDFVRDAVRKYFEQLSAEE